MSAQQDWDLQTTKQLDELRKDFESSHESKMELLLAKHQAELSAVSSAYEVARELQSETSASLTASEEDLAVARENLVQYQKKHSEHSMTKLREVRTELQQMKMSMLALRREASAFTRPAPQLQQLERVLDRMFQEEVWCEHDGRHDPSPNCTLDDPMIAHLMSSWTTDKAKLKLLKTWLKHVLSNKKIGATKKFRPGVELTKLPAEVSEGFLRIIVPMLRSRDDIDVSAYVRTRRETWKELRLRVAPKGEMPPFVGEVSGSRARTPVNGGRGSAQSKSRLTSSFSTSSGNRGLRGSLLESKSVPLRMGSTPSPGAEYNHPRGTAGSVGSTPTNTSSSAGVGNPFSTGGGGNGGNSGRIGGRIGGRIDGSGSGSGSGVPLHRRRRSSASDARELGCETPEWGSDSGASRSATPTEVDSPWMQKPTTGGQEQSDVGRVRRGSWAGPASPRSGGGDAGNTTKTQLASRKLNLSKINNRLSKLRDFS